jgi:hypothetical protein
MVSQMEDFTSSPAFRVAGPKAFAEARITHNDVDHLMIYDAPCSLPGASFAHLPIYGLEDLGFVPRGESGAFIAGHNNRPATSCRSTPTAAAFPTCIPHVRHLGLAGERAPDARHRPCPDPRRSDLGLPRRRRHVRRVGDDHHVERAALKPHPVCEPLSLGSQAGLTRQAGTRLTVRATQKRAPDRNQVARLQFPVMSPELPLSALTQFPLFPEW